MTAEIVIINQHGVAMAADSAVTIGNQKIINSAIKLFSLSRTEPVGIMIYGNANLLNIPWETLIKIYRKSHNSKLEYLKDYGDSFIQFLKDRLPIFSIQQQASWALSRIQNVFNDIIENIREELRKLQISGIKLNENQVTTIAESLINEFNSALIGNDFAYHESFSVSSIESLEVLITEQINEIFPNFKDNINICKLLIEIGKSSVLRCIDINASGIVVAGFGDHDIFPSVITYDIYGVYDNKLLFRINNDKTIINNNIETMESAIIPFAQEDVVRSFLEGIHPELFDYSMNYTNEMLQDLLASASDQSLKDNASNISQVITQRLMVGMQNFMSRHLLSPMIDMIQALPKDDLANMAEALVNMTAFRRKMTFSSLETVGGPVDVAVISKGDGLVWVKRKHYFPSELNKHFFDNYFK